MRAPDAICDNRGVTLIELILAIVVISVALAGILSVMVYSTSHSSDPVVRHQSIAIAEAYMEEIALKHFADPDIDGEVARALFDNVADYNGLVNTGARDQNDNAIPGLENYRVSVSVTAANFGPAGNEVAGLRIEVTVANPSGESFVLAGYRTNY